MNDNATQSTNKIVLGVTGSIAAYKAAIIARLLLSYHFDPWVVLTAAAERFVTRHTFQALIRKPVYLDMFAETPEGCPPHLLIPEGARAILIAPASADFIGRLAAGFGDDLLSCVCLAATCPIIIAPAMHTSMWCNPIVKRNVTYLQSVGYSFIGPDEGDLAGGDAGKGRLIDPNSILESMKRIIQA